VRILVTGATGFIGRRLVPVLLEQGHSVVAVGREAPRLERAAGAETVVADLTNPGVADGFPRRIDAIVHLAQANVARAAERELDAVNVRGTATVLDYAGRAGASSFVFASSGSVYGGAARPLSESDLPRPHDAYARSKVAAESLVEGFTDAFTTTILRLFVPYGPGQQGRLVPELVTRVRDGRPVTLREGGRPRLSPIYLDHVVDVLAQAASAPEASLVNVAGEEVLSIRDMAETIARVLGTEPRFDESSGNGQEDLVGDTAALRRRFRLPDPLVTFEQGVAAMLVESTPALG
jgi:UDP-glucose 4-epimerase